MFFKLTQISHPEILLSCYISVMYAIHLPIHFFFIMKLNFKKKNGSCALNPISIIHGGHILPSLCQRLGLTRSVRYEPRERSASIERRRRESPPEAKDKRSESFAGGARGFGKQNLSPLHHEGANTQIKS